MYTYSLDIASIIVTGAGQAVVDDLVDNGYPVDRNCLLVPGAIAWDNCDCGQLAQTITTVTPSSNFPNAAADNAEMPCGPNQVIVNVTLSLVRCVTGPSDNGDPPRCVDLLGDALQIERDRFLTRRALRCYLKSLFDTYLITGFTLPASTTVGPEGMCAGIQQTYSFGLANAGCC